jgi:hypothetical protein
VFLSLILPHNKNVQEIKTNLKAIYLAQNMEMVKIKVLEI